ncbi:hypothetical protein I7I50_08931 [Histoplasma capsulatum G186AR]|uniref:Uncharacterized protein n=1 Tax=Ajellomyces capsulatus TaxID=5037 RepID=A0A8H7YRL4_AJECA|nr:hypothetical protein I7I52_06447 [Histoplasma capsulatum]QSS73969.1 hypothetical protein I7I50_08931 [Histoplasma capsulatum G186AR]
MSWAGVPWQPGIQASSCGQRLCGALGTINLRYQLDNKEQQKVFELAGSHVLSGDLATWKMGCVSSDTILRA